MAKNRSPKATRPNIPGYGLPKSKKGLLAWKWAEQRLKKSRQFLIATTRADGRPHLMIIWALWMDNRLYFSTGKESVKARNLRQNPNCSMSTDKPAEAVILDGTVKTERDVVRIRSFIALYEKKYKYRLGEMSERMIALEDPVFFLTPKVGFGLWEKKFDTSATRWLFE